MYDAERDKRMSSEGAICLSLRSTSSHHYGLDATRLAPVMSNNSQVTNLPFLCTDPFPNKEYQVLRIEAYTMLTSNVLIPD